MADEVEATAEKKGGNGLLIVLIVLIVILFAAIGGGGYYLFTSGILDKGSNEGAKVEQKKDTAEEEKSAEKFQAQIDSLVLNITDAKGRAHLMKLSFSMKSTEPTIAAIVETNKAEITDAVIRQVSARSSEELLTVGGKAMLKEEMIEEINNILNDATPEETVKRDCVKDLYFTSFVIK